MSPAQSSRHCHSLVLVTSPEVPCPPEGPTRVTPATLSPRCPQLPPQVTLSPPGPQLSAANPPRPTTTVPRVTPPSPPPPGAPGGAGGGWCRCVHWRVRGCACVSVCASGTPPPPRVRMSPGLTCGRGEVAQAADGGRSGGPRGGLQLPQPLQEGAPQRQPHGEAQGEPGHPRAPAPHGPTATSPGSWGGDRGRSPRGGGWI